MTNLNFLSNLCGLGRASQSSDVGSRCRVVADLLPSFCRVNHVLTLLVVMLFTIGVGNAWGADTELTFTLSSNPGGWPTSSSAGNYTYTIGGNTYTFALGANVYCNSGYLMLKYTTSLGLPAISGKKLTKVVVSNSSGCSTSTRVGISSSSSSASYITGGAYQTYSSTSSTYTYNLSGTSDNTMYYLYITNKNCQITQVVLTYSGGSTPSHTLSSAVSPAASGSVDLSATSVAEGSTADATATPAAHYTFTSWSISGTGASLSSTTTNPTTVTMGTANTTVTANFTEDPTYTVTWVAGSNPSFSTQTNYAGTALTDPGTPSAALYCPGGKEFVGWTATPIVGEGSAPADLFTSVSGKSIPVGGTTYYAVFATASGGGGDVTDVINNSVTTSHLGASGTSSWVSIWETSAMTSGAKYKIRSMGINGATDYALQWNSNGYLFCSSAPSGGRKLKSITITTKATKSINLYGSTTVYSDKATATSLGNLSATTSGATYALTSDQLANNYTCVGINGTASSTQVVSISITYSAGVSYSNYATTCCTPLASINGSFLWTNLFEPLIPCI